MYSRNPTKREIYFKEFRETNPWLVLGLIIISLGFYIITWIYSKNKEFEHLDKFSPDAARGAAVMMLLPFGWFYVVLIIKRLIIDNLFVEILEIVIWGFILFLVLKYIYEFCLSFGRITRTNGIYWFFLFFIPIITIPAMQMELNSHFNRMAMQDKSNNFYNH
ncbi:MAG: hypothetical protein PF569_03025 [Candidatus Woesearchaeota archaeon]|jgi:hypothetical protein|nr:hypothetical protein [Candidatus Woesearchaeota archaeon]